MGNDDFAGVLFLKIRVLICQDLLGTALDLPFLHIFLHLLHHHSLLLPLRSHNSFQSFDQLLLLDKNALIVAIVAHAGLIGGLLLFLVFEEFR